MKNPLSLEPSVDTITINTKTKDGTYDYSSGVDDELIANNVVGSFVSVAYEFSNR